MRRFAAWIGMAVLIGLTGVYWVLNKPPEQARAVDGDTVPQRRIERPARPAPPPEKYESRVTLYFGDEGGMHLKPEERNLRHSGGSVSLGSGIVQELILGPKTGLVRTLPARTALNAFYLTPENGTAYVDLSEAVSEDHPGGAMTEYLAVFSIVNSLIVNLSEITQVKILIAGREAATLAGHIDLGRAYSADMVLNR